jgi:hypothetical protein
LTLKEISIYQSVLILVKKKLITIAIKELPEAEVRDLAKWLQEYLEEKWDRQIEADFESGKLDRLITRAESDIARNKLRK